MTSTLTAKSPGVPHLLILDLGDDLGKGRIVKSTPEGDNLQVLVSGITTLPDGVQVDTRASKGQIYWTCMGVPSLNDGHLMRADADGSNTEIIVKEGITFTPKQLAIDVENEKLYWSDREGMRVMRCSLDGSNVETLICAGSSDDERKDGTRHCVGVAVDVDRSLLYWTQKVRSEDDPTAYHPTPTFVIFRGLPRDAKVAFFAPISTFPPDRRPQPEPTSRPFSPTSPNQSTSKSITESSYYTGPTEEILPLAILSTERMSPLPSTLTSLLEARRKI